MRAHGVLALGRLFDQVEFLMDFSSPLTDEAMEACGGGGVSVGVGGGALLAWSAALGCRRPVGVTWALWLVSRVLRHKEPTLRSQVSDSGRVRKSGDCKDHPTRPLPPPPPCHHLSHTLSHVKWAHEPKLLVLWGLSYWLTLFTVVVVQYNLNSDIIPIHRRDYFYI